MTSLTHAPLRTSPTPFWRPMVGRACLAMAGLIFAMSVLAAGFRVHEGGGVDHALFGLAFGFFFAVPALIVAQQSMFRAGLTRACVFAGRVLGVSWLAAIAWLVGLYL